MKKVIFNMKETLCDLQWVQTISNLPRGICPLCPKAGHALVSIFVYVSSYLGQTVDIDWSDWFGSILSIYTFINISDYFSIYLYICLSIYIFVYLSIHLSIYLYICLSIYILVYLFIYLSIYLYNCLSI